MEGNGRRGTGEGRVSKGEWRGESVEGRQTNFCFYLSSSFFFLLKQG